MSKEIITTEVEGWTVKLREGKAEESSKVILLLHGWTGDEKSMWAFEELLPENAFVIVPRAPYLTKGTDLGGYSWVDKTVDFLPVKRDFMPAVYGVNELLEELSVQYPEINFNQMSVVGFSQGAAMAIAFTDAYAEKVSKLGVLAGFLPDDVDMGSEGDRWLVRVY